MVMALTAGRYKLVLPYQVARKQDKLPDEDHALEPVPDSKGSEPLEQLDGSKLVLRSLTNPVVSREIDVVKQYLQDSRVTDYLHRFTREILQNVMLPYNPYPSYIQRFRHLAERFHLNKKSLSEIHHSIDTPSIPPKDGVLASVKSSSTDFIVWGLEHMVSHINCRTLESYSEMIVTSTVKSEAVSQKYSQQISVLLSLSGPCVFNNSFYRDWMSIELKVAVIVTSQDSLVAAKYFSFAVIEDLKHVYSSQRHVLLDLNVPVEDGRSWTTRTWTRTELTEFVSAPAEESEILSVLVRAVTAKKRILLNCLLSQSSKSSAAKTFLPATKTYYMMFLQSAVQAGGSVASFNKAPPRLVVATLPFQALHEGVFLDRGHAEQYVATFQKYYSLDQQAPPAAGRKRAAKLNPMHRDILGKIVQAWQMKIASLKLEQGAYSIVHYMLLLTLSQTQIKSFSKHVEEDIAIQISRLLRGTGAKLKSALFYHTVLEQLLAAGDENLSLVVDRVVAKYKDRLLDVFSPELCARSSETQSLKHMVRNTLGGATKHGGSLHAAVRARELPQLANAVSCVLLGFTEDALQFCPAIRALKSQLDGAFPHLVAQPVPPDPPTQYQHGIKNNAWLNVDAMRIDKRANAMTSQAPKQVASHFTIMQYCVDMRIDQVLLELYENLLLVQDHLPPNPYPILVSIMRKSNMCAQAFSDTETATAQRLLQRKVVLAPESANIFTVVGVAAFGKKTALAFFSPRGYKQASEIATQVLLMPPGDGTTAGLPVQAGPFLVATCGGLTPPSAYYGAVSPYLQSLTIDEHCFVRGPSTLMHQAPNALAKLVLANLRGLLSRGIISNRALLGGVVLDLRNLASSSIARFDNEFSSAVNGQHTICIEVFYPLEWRYILVRKRMLVYLVDGTNDRITPSFTLDGEDVDFRSSTIFLHPGDAEYTRKQLPESTPSAADASLLALWQSRDWSGLVAALTFHAQQSLGSEIIVDRKRVPISEKVDNSEATAQLAFCWRYNNGVPGLLDYLSSINAVLRGVLGYGVDALDESLQLLSIVDQAKLQTMSKEYAWKLSDVLYKSSTLAPLTLRNLLRQKIDSIFMLDPSSNNFIIKFDKESIKALSEVDGHLLAIRNATAEDLIAASPAVFKYIEKRRAEDKR